MLTYKPNVEFRPLLILTISNLYTSVNIYVYFLFFAQIVVLDLYILPLDMLYLVKFKEKTLHIVVYKY